MYKSDRSNAMYKGVSPQRIDLNYIFSFSSITEDNDDELQVMMYLMSNYRKILKEYRDKCIKGRDYLEAQKAVDKIQEVTKCIKRRDNLQVDDKMNENKLRILDKHELEKDQLHRKYQTKLNEMEDRFMLLDEKRTKAHEEQKVKLKKQAELALSVGFSPDDRLKKLRRQQKQFVSRGDLWGAQRKKEQIQVREIQLQQKHRQLRDANIRSMIRELESKFEKQCRDREMDRKIEYENFAEERRLKESEMQKRHEKQLRENKWIYDQQKRLRRS